MAMKTLKTISAALVLAITASSCHQDGEQADATSPLKDSPVVAQQVIALNDKYLETFKNTSD